MGKTFSLKMLFRWLDESSGTLQYGPPEVCRRFLAPGIVHCTTLLKSMNYLYWKRQELMCQMERKNWDFALCKVGAKITQLQNKHPLWEGHRVEHALPSPLGPVCPQGLQQEYLLPWKEGLTLMLNLWQTSWKKCRFHSFYYILAQQLIKNIWLLLCAHLRLICNVNICFCMVHALIEK